MVIALAAQRGWKIYQLDVKSTFLHGTLNEDVNVEQPKGYERKGNEHLVYKLHKALYGLKQAPGAWFSRIESYFVTEGFQRSQNEKTLFFKWSKEGILIINVYVDDLIYTGNDELMMSEFKESMKKVFDMTDLGKMRFFLGIEVLQCSDGIYVYQKKYTQEILRHFGMEESNSACNPIVPRYKLCKDEGGVKVNETQYKQMVGSLMYITTTRLDLMFSISLISRYMSQPTEMHTKVAKRILRYLKGTENYGILYRRGGTSMCLPLESSQLLLSPQQKPGSLQQQDVLVKQYG